MSIKKIWGVTPWEIIDSPRGLRFFSGGKKKIKNILLNQVLNCKTKKLHFWNFQKEMNRSRNGSHNFFFPSYILILILLKDYELSDCHPVLERSHD